MHKSNLSICHHAKIDLDDRPREFIYDNYISIEKGFMLTFYWIQMHIHLNMKFLRLFQFSESRIFMTPSHKLLHKLTKIMFHITKFTLSHSI